ncbi:LysM peptidoglycan-binding domain-containing protein [Streptococcus mitis]|uniref:LysM peptidoglycan-binding domain-containing protein n=1 Tax=Streptococcus mitis TaxID=28037 RepID=UPI0039C15A2E
MRQTNVRGTLSLRGFRKLRTGAIVATGVILLGLGFLAPTVSANEQDGVWVARTVAEVKADIQNINNLSHYTIKWGDTLSAISGATGLSVDSLVEINRIANRDLIFANNKLYFSEEAFLKDGNTEVKRQRVSIDNSGSCQSYEVETKTDTVTGEQTTTVKQTTPVVVETPAVSAPKADESASPAPKVEEPATPAPKAEEPSATTPKAEEPVSPAPKAEEPASPAPKAEEPTTSAPKAEEPSTPAPKVEEPVTSAPKVDEPSTPAPKTDEPAASAPKADEPSTPAPKADESATPAPKADEPAASAPKADEPSTPAPKADESATPAPKADEPATPAPKAEEPAATTPKAEEPVSPAPKVEEPTTPAPKADESGSSVESPSTGNHSDESGTPSETPTGDSTATQPSDSTSSPVTPSEEAPVTSGDTNSTTQPAEETGNSETTAEPSNTPSAGATNEAGNSESSSSVTDDTTSNVETIDQPVASNPSSESPATPAPKSDEPATPAPKVEEPVTPAPKDGESGSSVTSPSTGNHSDESGAPSTTPTGDSTATQPSDSTSSPVTPSEEAPVTSGDTNSTTQPAGESGSSETTSEPSNTPSEEATNDSGNAATSTPTPATSTPEPKSEEELKKEETLKSAKKESIDDNIGEVVKIKADAIEKVPDADEKARLKEALKALQDKAIEEINKAKDDEEVATVTEKYQNEINALDVPGEEVSSPNYGREGLTNNGPGGTTIDNGSTAIGHGASGTSRSATASPTQPSSTSERGSSFRNAPSVQAIARRVARSTSEPDGTVNISYNFAGMPDIHGFLSDPGENNTVTIPAGTSEAQAKELVKEKIQAKIKDLATRGYHVKNDIIFEQDTTVKNYNYVVTFTKEATGTSGFRMAPAVQPRASRNRRSLEQPAPQKVKVNVFYNFDQMKDIAGFLGDINGTSLEIAEGLSNEQVKAAVKSQVEAKKGELSKRGYTFKEDYVYQANGKDYNYVVTFTKEATGTSGFRMAPAVQPRASRNRRSLEQPAPQKVKVNVFYNFDQMKDIAGFLGDINGTSLEVAEGLSNEQVKAAVKSQVDAKKEELSKRGYTFKEDYVYQANGKDYNYVVTFSKAAK